MSYYSETDDISFIPLTHDEEKELFRRWHVENSIEARDLLITKHLKFAAKFGLRCAKGFLEEEDAISAANLALMNALESKAFDPSRGYRFSTFLRRYIAGEVSTAFREHDWKRDKTDDPSERQPENYALDAALTGQSLRRAWDPEIGGTHGCRRIRRGGFVSNVPATRCAHHEEDQVQDSEVEERDMARAKRNLIFRHLKLLPLIEALVLREHYFSHKSFAEIGREQDLTREGVRKAYNRGMGRLRRLLSTKGSEIS
jgi:RNA polymerase sigma factor (sigma-70 family)